MDTKRRFSMLYVKYVIKSPLLFYLFLALGVILFIVLTYYLRISEPILEDMVNGGRT